MPSRAEYFTTRHSGTPWLQWPGGARTLWTRLGFGFGAALLLLWLSPPTAQAQAGTPVQPAQVESASADGDLELVVALFRHGVRAPLPKFANEEAKKHSGKAWPELSEWNAKNWGDLTQRGAILADSLGRFYANRYKGPFNGRFKVFFWADVDQRTKDTANSLADGFKAANNPDVIVKFNGSKPDPLYHAFAARCGEPSAKMLLAISANVSVNAQSYIAQHKLQFNELKKVLACPPPQPLQPPQCTPISSVSDNSAGYCQRPTDACSSPLKWAGQFPYASSASEAFLLEYANGMPGNAVGWGNVSPSGLKSMLALHEFYFDQTQRERYLAAIDASNLIREINATLQRQTGGCQHAPLESQFIGLVGHDTNLASVGKLLDLTWSFNGQGLPDDTRGIPDNDALPAGALVFELRKRRNPKPPDEGHFVRVYYVTQSLKQMRDDPKKATAFVLTVTGSACQGSSHCDIPLTAFNQVVVNNIGKEFLSHCNQKGEQVCP